MSDLNTTISHPLMQSRNGGKIHYASCGNRSRHAGRVRGTENMTHGEVIAKYGTDLCKRCFPEAHAPAVDVEATPAPITKVVTVTESAPAITVTDINTGQTATIEASDFAQTVTPWFPEAPEDVTAAITDLGDELTYPQWSTVVDDLSHYLGLTIDILEAEAAPIINLSSDMAVRLSNTIPGPAIKVSRAKFIDTLVTVSDEKDGESASERIVQALGDERVRDLHRFAMNASATYSYMGVSVIDKATAGTMYPVKLAGNGWHTGSLFEVDLATIVWEFLAGLDPKHATR